jgi:ABC-2 type transport system ATP-binding protein
MRAITVDQLTKQYGAMTAVNHVSFEVAAGEVYALLGHNGAGKTTTVEILEGHRRRTSGRVEVLGTDPDRAGPQFRDRIGIVLQSTGVEPELSVLEALEVYGAAYRHPRPAAELIELVGLDDKAMARIGSLSGGQRRRLDLALGLVGRPELIFLDEPTTGFDPGARRQSWALIESLCREGTTVLLTTHYLDEAEHLADRVGVLRNGRLVAEGRPEELIAGHADTVITFTVSEPVLLADLRLEGLEIETYEGGQRVSLASGQPTLHLHALTTWAIDHGIELEGLTIERPTLEDVFLRLGEE